MTSAVFPPAAFAAVLALFALPAFGETVASSGAERVAQVTVSGKSPRVTGSGTVIEERRALEGFGAVHLSGPIDVALKASDHESVTVRTDDNIVPLIETRVIEGEPRVLEIRVVPGGAFRTKHGPAVVVEFKAVSQIVMRGSGDLRADRIEADDFAISMSGSGDARIGELRAAIFAAVLSGSGDLSVRGRADQQAFRLAGSGDVAAGRLEGRVVKAVLSGSGDASVNASESLEASISGSGDVIYRGSPRISQRIRGSGDVRRAR